jgi:hypothetical protein
MKEGMEILTFWPGILAAVVCRQPLLGKHYSKYSFRKILLYLPKALSLLSFYYVEGKTTQKGSYFGI